LYVDNKKVFLHVMRIKKKPALIQDWLCYINVVRITSREAFSLLMNNYPQK